MLKSDLIKSSAVGFTQSLSAGVTLPAHNPDVDVSRLQLDRKRDSRFLLAGNYCCPRATKRIIDGLPARGIIDDGTTHALHWFLCGMNGLGILVAAFNLPQCTLLSIPVPMPGIAHRVPAGLMLPMVVR